MRHDAFQEWRREREAVEQEMDLLITAGLPASNEERQVRRTRFAALLERREAAARNLLHSDRTRRLNRSPADLSGPGDRLISAAHAGAGVEAGPATFVPLPDGEAKPTLNLSSRFMSLPLPPPLTRLHSLSTLPLSPPMLTRPRPLALPLTSAPLRLWHSRLMPPLLPSLRRLRPLAFPLTLPSLQLNKPALASDAPDFSPDSATVAAAGLPLTRPSLQLKKLHSRLMLRPSFPTLPRSRPVAFPLTRLSLQLKAALAPDVAAVLPDPATAAATGLPADAAEPATEKAALASDATDCLSRLCHGRGRWPSR